MPKDDQATIDIALADEEIEELRALAQEKGFGSVEDYVASIIEEMVKESLEDPQGLGEK